MYRTTYFVAYSLICGLLTTGLAVTLHWVANQFLHDRFSRNSRLMLAVARVLAAGFYLVCCGYFAMTVLTELQLSRLFDVVNIISIKAGFFLLLMGTILIVNLLILALIRGHAEEAS